LTTDEATNFHVLEQCEARNVYRLVVAQKRLLGSTHGHVVKTIDSVRLVVVVPVNDVRTFGEQSISTKVRRFDSFTNLSIDGCFLAFLAKPAVVTFRP
jgi:hypothetical protein